MKKLTEKEEDFALTLACMMGHQQGMSYRDGLRESINLYEDMTGDKQFNKIFSKKKWYQFWK